MNSTVARLIFDNHYILSLGIALIITNNCKSLLHYKNEGSYVDGFAKRKCENIAHILINSKFNHLKGDIRDLTNCLKSVVGVNWILLELLLGFLTLTNNNLFITKDIFLTAETNTIRY